MKNVSCDSVSCDPGAFVSPLIDGVTTSWIKPSSGILWSSEGQAFDPFYQSVRMNY